MYATINLPGNQHFQYYGPARKKECETWLDEQKARCQDLHGGAWISIYLPAQIVSNKEAEAWKYRDGTRVIRQPDDVRRWIADMEGEGYHVTDAEIPR